jgi:hypothetical protein
MADDRLFIKCKGCGGCKMLLKHFAGTGLTHRDNGILPWLDGHRYCHQTTHMMNLGNDTCFTLLTEDNLSDGDHKLLNYVPL